jgi:outer membrane protein assembly factor BamB
MASSAAASFAPTGWVQGGYGPSNSGYNPSEYLLKPSVLPGLAQRWSAGPTDAGMSCSRQSPPVTYAGRVFLTDQDGISGYDATTGTRLWTWKYADPGDTYTPELAVDGRVLVVATSTCQSQSDPDGEVLGLDTATGAVRWRQRTETPATGLVVDRGIAVVGGSEEGYTGSWAFRTATGTQLWEREDLLPGEGAAAAGRVLLSGDAGVAAVEPATGRTRWTSPKPWTVLAADPSGAYFYVAQSATTLVKIRASNGHKVWVRKGLTWPIAIDDARVYAASATVDGQLVALDARSGNPLWKRTFTHFSEPTVAAGVLWLTLPSHGLKALDPATGHEFPVAAALGRAHPTGRAVVADGWLYLTDGQTLRAFNSRPSRTRADHRI